MKKINYFIFLIFLVAFLIRLFPIPQELIWDEAVYLQHTDIISGGSNTYNEFYFRPPILPLILSIGKIFADSLIPSYFIVALISALGTIFIYLLGKELFNKQVGVISSIMLALSPFLIQTSHQILTDNTAITISLISLYLFIKAIKTKKNYLFVLAGVFLSVSILTKYTSLILIPTILLFALFNNTKIRNYLSTIIGFLIPMIPFFIFLTLNNINILSPFLTYLNASRAETLPILCNYTKSFLIVFPIITILGLILLLMPLIKNKLNKNDLILAIWITAFLAFMQTIHYREPRYLLVIAPPIFLLSSRGIYFFFKEKLKFKKITITLFILLAIISFIPFVPLTECYPKEQANQETPIIANYIKINLDKNKILYANHYYPLLAYYTKFNTTVVWPQNEEFYKVFPKNMQKEGYFIYYKGIKHPDQQFLDNNEKFIKLKEFDTAILYSYNPQEG
ncbi:MAG: glycosyltransferase family 39 protein [Candidatus Woesearchaeota archaeon]|nr:MAG: glycosyltransferase family 39 protein [Candidatus Woesearchaeota archaeon]